MYRAPGHHGYKLEWVAELSWVQTGVGIRTIMGANWGGYWNSAVNARS